MNRSVIAAQEYVRGRLAPDPAAEERGEVVRPDFREREKRQSRRGKRICTADIWLETESGDLLRIQMSAGGHAAKDRGQEVEWNTLDAACWLMPNLSRELIAEVLELSSAENDPSLRRANAA